MRLAWPWIIAALVAIGATNLLWWQQSRIEVYRTRLAWQAAAPAEASVGDPAPRAMFAAYRPSAAAGGSARTELSPREAASSPLSNEERQLILDQYRDAMAQLNLSPAVAARLQDLLVERIQAILAVEDQARRQGYAEASALVEQAVAQTIAREDERIVSLIGLEGDLRLNGRQEEAQPAEESPAPTTVVNIIAAPPATPDYTTAEAVPADTSLASGYWPYSGFYYPPVVGYAAIGQGRVHGAPRRFEAARTFRASFSTSAGHRRR